MERKPLRLIRTPRGETVLDMGQNMVGWLRFRVHAPRGRTLKLQFGEQLENGCFSRANLRTAQAAFTWRSDGVSRLAEPFFTWYGFRYVLLEGFDEPVDPEDFTGCVVCSIQCEVICSAIRSFPTEGLEKSGEISLHP